MTPLVIAGLLTAGGCVLHFFASRPPNPAATLVRLGDWFILAGALAITALLTGSV
jgi:hypothetical protein